MPHAPTKTHLSPSPLAGSLPRSTALAPGTRGWANKADALASDQRRPHAPPTGTPNSSLGTPLPRSPGHRLTLLGGGSGRNSGPPTKEHAWHGFPGRERREQGGGDSVCVPPAPRGDRAQEVPLARRTPPSCQRGLPGAAKGEPWGEGLRLAAGKRCSGVSGAGAELTSGAGALRGLHAAGGVWEGHGRRRCRLARAPQQLRQLLGPGSRRSASGQQPGGRGGREEPAGRGAQLLPGPGPLPAPPQPQDRCGPAPARARPLPAPGPADASPADPSLVGRAPPRDPAATSRPRSGVRGSCALTRQPRPLASSCSLSGACVWGADCVRAPLGAGEGHRRGLTRAGNDRIAERTGWCELTRGVGGGEDVYLGGWKGRGGGWEARRGRRGPGCRERPGSFDEIPPPSRRSNPRRVGRTLSAHRALVQCLPASPTDPKKKVSFQVKKHRDLR